MLNTQFCFQSQASQDNDPSKAILTTQASEKYQIEHIIP